MYLTFSISCENLIGIPKYFALNKSRASSARMKSEPSSKLSDRRKLLLSHPRLISFLTTEVLSAVFLGRTLEEI
jgi:hypothetical protein